MKNKHNSKTNSITSTINNNETTEENANTEKIEIDNNILTNHTKYTNSDVISIILG